MKRLPLLIICLSLPLGLHAADPSVLLSAAVPASIVLERGEGDFALSGLDPGSQLLISLPSAVLESGFRLEDMLSSAARLCARLFPRNEASIQDIPQRAPLPKSLFARLKARLGRPGPIFLVLFPILVTALWYLVCASCINSLDLPWITRS